ncbi:GNAT family N-acetyltransferase [Kribbella sp. NPDC051587]|uniref:GNAT family N-acetyltransferase n=1 Tax=Kribbella sp. NPDC051587 TaxID=3364119 RepID=UPI0037BC7D82
MVLIRSAQPGEADALAELHARSRAVYYRAGGHDVATHPDEGYREGWRRLVDDSRIIVLVAVSGDELVGVLTVDVSTSYRKRVRLTGIFVEPGQWSIGVGSALMARFIAIAQESDAVGEVEVWERNSRAIQFYERHGWTRDGTSRPGPAGAAYLGYVHPVSAQPGRRGE